MAEDNPNPFAPIVAALDAQELALAETIAKATQTLAKASADMDRVKQARAALTAAQTPPDESVEADAKLAPTIRNIFRANGSKSYSATEMRDAVVETGYDASKHPNLLAAVHGVLKRMEESKNVEVRSKTRKDGSIAYVWAAATRQPTSVFPHRATISNIDHYMPKWQSVFNNVSTMVNSPTFQQYMEQNRKLAETLRADTERLKAAGILLPDSFFPEEEKK